AFSPDRRTLAVAAGNRVRLWDLATRRPGQALDYSAAPTPNYLPSLSYTRDGRRLLAGDRVFDTATRPPRIAFDATNRPGNDPRNLRGLRAISPDGSLVVDSVDHSARVSELATGKTRIPQFPRSVILAVFSPDGKILLTEDGEGTGWLWDVATGQ